MPERTPSQTVGPYLHIGLTQGAYGAREIFSATVAEAGMPGARIRIVGHILDGNELRLSTLPLRLARFGFSSDRSGRSFSIDARC